MILPSMNYTKRSAEKQANYRDNASEERKAQMRERTKLRMRAHRARKPASAEKSKKTRAFVDEQRKKWREAKQKQAEKITPQKRAAINKKRREQYAQQKAAALAKSSPVPCKSSTSATTPCTASFTLSITTTASSPGPSKSFPHHSAFLSSPITPLSTASTSSSTASSQPVSRTPAARRQNLCRVKKVFSLVQKSYGLFDPHHQIPVGHLDNISFC